MRDRIITVELDEAEDFVKIVSGNGEYYGGNQAWFEWNGEKGREHVARKGACGTVASANLSAYMARTNPAYAELYPYSDYNKESFVSHMKDVYGYVRPYHIGRIPLGIWPVGRLARGMERFAKDRGVRLQAVRRQWAFNRRNVIRYMTEGLERNLPIAMLVGPHKLRQVDVRDPGGESRKEDISLHWVTATGLIMDPDRDIVRVRVSTWGGWALLDLDEYLRERIYGGMIYFE